MGEWRLLLSSTSQSVVSSYLYPERSSYCSTKEVRRRRRAQWGSFQPTYSYLWFNNTLSYRAAGQTSESVVLEEKCVMGQKRWALIRYKERVEILSKYQDIFQLAFLEVQQVKSQDVLVPSEATVRNYIPVGKPFTLLASRISLCSCEFFFS